MRIADLMHDKVFTVGEDDLIDRVFLLVHYEHIRHVPVVNKKGEVIGIVSDRDLCKAMGPKESAGDIDRQGEKTSLHFTHHKVRYIMHRGVITIDPHDHPSQAAAIMAKHKIGALPVVKNGKLVGIITSTDLLRAFSKLEFAREQEESLLAKAQKAAKKAEATGEDIPSQ